MTHLRIHLSLVARFEGAEETVVASRHMRLCYISAKFALHSIDSPVKGSRQLCCRGVELKPINYQLLALRCGQQPLACHGFACTHRSSNRKNRIGTM